MGCLPYPIELSILDTMIKPAYFNVSIVNLMASILAGLSNHANHHPPLSTLDKTHFMRARNVVLVVIDGLGYNYLSGVTRRGCLHDYLQGSLTSVFPSTTATAITTFMTGLAPQQHGLIGWFTYFRELASIMTVLPAKPRLGCIDAGKSHIDVASLYGHTPLPDLLDVNCHIVTPRNIAYSEYSLAHRGKATTHPYANLNECFATTRDIIKNGREKKYIYTYWPQFDGMAHEKGVGSKEVADHFQEIDKAFGQFIDEIKGTNTLVIATADHGIIDSGPKQCIEVEHHPDLQDMLAMPLSGERRMAYCYVKAGRHPDFVHYLHNNLNEQITVIPSRQLLEQNYYGLGPAHPRLHQRIGDYALIMNDHFTIMDTMANERHFYHIGTHGGMSEDEMLVPLIIAET